MSIRDVLHFGPVRRLREALRDARVVQCNVAHAFGVIPGRTAILSLALAAGFLERYLARIQAYTAGYEREIVHLLHLSTALGAQWTGYGVPPVLANAYGSHPFGVVVFLRLRAK